MKKGVSLFLFLILVLSISFASAGLFDFFKKAEVTGNVIDYSGVNTCVDCMANNGKWCVDPEGYSDSRCIDSTKLCAWYEMPSTSCDTGGVEKTTLEDPVVVEEPVVEEPVINEVPTIEEKKIVECLDTDGGKNYVKKGEVSVTGDRIRIYPDFCKDDYILNESYCEGIVYKSILKDCGVENKLCQNGACVAVEEFVIRPFVDFRINGKDFFYDPVIFKSDLNLSWKVQGLTGDVHCVGYGTWTPKKDLSDCWGKQYWGDSGSESLIAAFAEKCNLDDLTPMSNATIGIGCYNGTNQVSSEIHLDISEKIVCDINHPLEDRLDIYNYGESLVDGKLYKEFCVDSDTVKEYYCEDNTFKEMDYGCEFGCVDGACLKEGTSCTILDGEGVCEYGGVNYSIVKEGCSDSVTIVFLYGENRERFENFAELSRVQLQNEVKVKNLGSPCSEDIINLRFEKEKEVITEKNLVAKGFRIEIDGLDVQVLLNYEEYGLVEEDNYWTQFSWSWDNGKSYERSSYTSREALSLNGFSLELDSDFNGLGISEIIVRADMNVISKELLQTNPKIEKDFIIELSKKDNCIQQKFKIINADLEPSMRKVIAIGSPKFCSSDSDEKPVLNCDNGCVVDDNCIPFSSRKAGKYCSFEGELKVQLNEEDVCENSWECKSNVCVDSQCISSSVFQKFLTWFKKIFGGEVTSTPNVEKPSEVDVREVIGDEDAAQDTYDLPVINEGTSGGDNLDEPLPDVERPFDESQVTTQLAD